MFRRYAFKMEVILFTVGAPQSKKVVILFIVGWMMLKTPPKMLLYFFRSTTFKKVVILFWHTAYKKVAILFRVDAVTTGSWTSLMFAAAHNHVSTCIMLRSLEELGICATFSATDPWA